MPFYRVTIVNGEAADLAYSADRRPRTGEAKREVEVTADSISGINSRVQEQMESKGFRRDEWKVLGYKVVEDMNELLPLPSVGSLIDPDTGMIYPQNVDGTPDLNSGVDGMDEPSDEWIDSLSQKDYILFTKIEFHLERTG